MEIFYIFKFYDIIVEFHKIPVKNVDVKIDSTLVIYSLISYQKFQIIVLKEKSNNISF